LALGHTTLDDYDTTTGELRREHPVPAGSQLEGAHGRLVVYTTGSTIHLLSGGHEKVIQTNARIPRQLRHDAQAQLHTALTSSGLYYSFNVDDPRYPGRVVFIPLARLPRR